MPVIKDVIDSLEYIKELHRKKNDDYANAADPFFNFNVQEYFLSMVKSDRDKVFFSLLGLKIARLANLLNSTNAPNNESIDDSFIDLATYTLLHKADVLERVIRKRKLEALKTQ